MFYSQETQRSRGFSLIEVIVALAVAATMIIAYVSLAERSLFMVDSSRALWENINFAQEYLGQNTFSENNDLTAMFNEWPDRDNAYWRLTKEEINIWDDLPPDFGSIVQATDKIPSLYKFHLETKLDDFLMSWEWYFH